MAQRVPHTRLAAHLAASKLPLQLTLYNAVSAVLSAPSLDAAERCEALLEVLEPQPLSQSRSENLVRALLEHLERFGLANLLETVLPTTTAATGGDDEEIALLKMDGNAADGFDSILFDGHVCVGPDDCGTPLKRLSHSTPGFQLPLINGTAAANAPAAETSLPKWISSRNKSSAAAAAAAKAAQAAAAQAAAAQAAAAAAAQAAVDAVQMNQAATMSSSHLTQSHMYALNQPYAQRFNAISKRSPMLNPDAPEFNFHSSMYTSPSFPFASPSVAHDDAFLMDEMDSLSMNPSRIEMESQSSFNPSSNAYGQDASLYDAETNFTALNPMELLQSVFVNVPGTVIRETLESNRYNTEATIEALFMMDTSSMSAGTADPTHFYEYGGSYGSGSTDLGVSPVKSNLNPTNATHALQIVSQTVSQQQQQASKQVCRHFLMGQCYRNDCWYSHDPEAVICKFWLQGRCLKGDACEFAHGDEIVEKVNAIAGQFGTVGSANNRSGAWGGDQVELRLEEETEFPSLSASVKNSSASVSATNNVFVNETKQMAVPSTNPGGSGNKIDFWAPTIKYTDVAKKPVSAATKSTAAPTTALGARRTPPSAIMDAVASGRKVTVIGGSSASASVLNIQPPTSVSTTTPTSTTPANKTKVSMKWVSTGNSLNTTYTDYRREAIEAAINRNKLFQRATEAYLSGNKAAARSLSLSAKRLNDQVQELHAIAAQRIFESRNADLEMDANERVVDLHGLHAQEAVAMLQSILFDLRTNSFVGTLAVVTGTGHHSRGRASVLPSVKEWAAAQNLQATDGTMEDGRGGMLLIKIK